MVKTYKIHLLHFLSAIFSGCLLSIAGSLHPNWIVAWVASVPILFIAMQSGGISVWWLAVLTGLVGGMSIFGYYVTVLGTAIALLLTLLKALMFSGGVRFACNTHQRLPGFIAVFAFPLWFSSFDFLISRFSANGTAGSIAYSQMDFPAILQIAALGGTPAITFVLYLSSSVVAYVIANFTNFKKTIVAVMPATLIVALSIVYGLFRIAEAPMEPEMLVAAAALDQESTMPLDWHASYGTYKSLLKQASDSHASVVVLPEEIALISSDNFSEMQREIGNFARNSNLSLAVGFRLIEVNKLRNVLLLFTPDGIAHIYDKHHLVPGLESNKITPGSLPPLIVDVTGIRIGGAICKDFDFVDVGRDLANAGASIVVAPAWDFGQDAWLHGRMAILRSVEGGFSLIRSARQGEMSLSDRYGRIILETKSGSNSPLLIANVPISKSQPTIYSQIGDLFGWICVFLLISFFAGAFWRRYRAD